MGLLDLLTREFSESEHAPPRQSLAELARVAERLVPLYLGKPQPLRPAAIAKKLVSLSRNLNRATTTATELGEHGLSQVLLASHANRTPECDDALTMISTLQDWASWSTRAAETATQMSLSAQDHKGGRTADPRLRGLVIIMADRYRNLLAIEPTHKRDIATMLGESTFDRFVKEALRLYAPVGAHYDPGQIDAAVKYALPDTYALRKRRLKKA